MSEHLSYDDEVVAYGLLLNTLADMQEKLSARRAYVEHRSGLARDLFVNLIDATVTQLSISQNEARDRLRTAFDNAHGIARLKAGMDATFGTGSNDGSVQYATQGLGDENDFGITSHTDTYPEREAA